MGESEKYVFDWKFYIGAILILATLGFGFHFVRRTLEISRGRDVQALVDQVARDSTEFARTQARSRVAAERHAWGLSDGEAKKIEEIYARAFHQHITIWRDDRMKGLTEAATRPKQDAVWSACNAEVSAYLASINKNRPAR